MADESRGVVSVPDVLPVLPLRETVIYPNTLGLVRAVQERSIRLVHDALASNRLAALVTEKGSGEGAGRPEDLHGVGTLAMIHELIRATDGTLSVVLQGIERIRLQEFVQTDPYLTARFVPAPDETGPGLESEALTRTARDLFTRLATLGSSSEEMGAAFQDIEDPRQAAYVIASTAPMSTAVRQQILELDPIPRKLALLIEQLQHELSVRQMMRKITSETTAEISKAQKEHVLRTQMEMIQRELGEESAERSDARELRERLGRTGLTAEARNEVTREIERLERTPSLSPEREIIRSYVDWLLKLPWGKKTGGSIDVVRARQVLDEDHFDLANVKDRVVEHLAVQKLREERHPSLPAGAIASHREPILCFVGPPGVGKTSLGLSIARAMDRKFTRMSLGGIHDEAEIRGHRRTYIGAMPGRILQAIARADAADPVFMLDEVDKLGVGFHGDPAAALLEVLDPAQNQAFVDTYLGVAFDLSQVLFILTANTVETIPAALLDRMEMLTLAGYTDAEKLYIALRYLIPKQLPAHGLGEHEVEVEPAAIRRVVREYTREAGVRSLERELAAILRKVVLRIAQGSGAPTRIRAEDVPSFLGPQRFFDEAAERIDRPGVATGLAWTSTGGEILFVEATMMPAAEERLLLTGMLGDVMRESAHAAVSYLRSNLAKLRTDPETFQRKIVHVHVPAGAIRKDGPSAGVAILAALASYATGRAVRNDLAMTGEITLRGKILPVGGIKEKVLAGHRAGLKTILLPRRNEGSLEDVPSEIREAMQIVLVESADEVLDAALQPAAEPETRPTTSPTMH